MSDKKRFYVHEPCPIEHKSVRTARKCRSKTRSVAPIVHYGYDSQGKPLHSYGKVVA